MEVNDSIINLLDGFRTGGLFTVEFRSEWALGHTVQINEKIYDHYASGDIFEFDEKPFINLSNLGQDDILAINVTRKC